MRTLRAARRLVILAAALFASFAAVSDGNGDARHLEPPQQAAVVVEPAAATIRVGETQQFQATGKYPYGSDRDITPQVAWTSSDTSVATVDAGGRAPTTQPDPRARYAFLAAFIFPDLDASEEDVRAREGIVLQPNNSQPWQ